MAFADIIDECLSQEKYQTLRSALQGISICPRSGAADSVPRATGDGSNPRTQNYPELFEIERALFFFLRTLCLLGRSSRLRLSSSAPILGTTALLGGTPSPTVRIAELRFFWSFALLAIARASKIQVGSFGPRRS